MNPPDPAPPADAPGLAALFDAPRGNPEAVAALAARADTFKQAVARGGAREDYERWHAGLDALQVALAILSAPAAAAGQASQPPFHEGEPRWKSLLARSAAR